MGKGSLFLKKIFKRWCLPALFIFIIIPTKILAESQDSKNLPRSYGYYILKDGEWISIPEMKTKLQALSNYTDINWGIIGIDSKPNLEIEDQSPAILIYGPGLDAKDFSLSRLWLFENLQAEDFYGTSLDSSSLNKPFGVEKDRLQSFGIWAPVGRYDIKYGPLPNHSDVIRLSLHQKLPPGVYAIHKGREFTSRPVQRNPNISVWAFEISAAEPTPLEPVTVEDARAKITRCCISNKLEGIENLRAVKNNFSVCDNQIRVYIELQGQRPGEILELIWVRPDGTIHKRQKQVLSSVGRIYKSFNPNNLLMPGQWRLAIKIYGELIQCIPFQVSAYQ